MIILKLNNLFMRIVLMVLLFNKMIFKGKISMEYKEKFMKEALKEAKF